MQKKYISNEDITARMFDNNFFEALSRVHPSVPVIMYLPLIVYLLHYSYGNPNVKYSSIILLFIFGTFIWTFTEYSLHRFIFHYVPANSIGQRLHYIFHGVHHAYPRDSRRLVMPPSVSIPLALLFYWMFYHLLGPRFVYPFFSGFLTGYLFYDVTHYAIHHFSIKNGLFLFIKKHHMRHHYMDATKGFGVSQPMWDIIYKTNFETENSARVQKLRPGDHV
ncbi:MAG: fatty acid hydroxylase [Ignavibacteria bacterium]|jgi:sterol desaturase/sphingolipid hydroxylase (fatty acid hydroxylase superfamily)|nr:fatty acid hydroxylase [Ignavibacteria bacterium]MCU7502712.1 fatty acid hydroxylase [Ignavibacteria bacterium]MCU7517359.1 fatty acid hydroxylase [Ignavibacteria bacterium]